MPCGAWPAGAQENQGQKPELLHAGEKEAHPAELPAQLLHSDMRNTLDIDTQISDPEVATVVNRVTNRILGLGWGG
jgi:hypothetical protein